MYIDNKLDELGPEEYKKHIQFINKYQVKN